MGQNAERLAKRYKISRYDQDHFSLESHHKAAKATEEGFLDRQIVPSFLPSKFQGIRKDNGVRGDSTFEKLAKLKPVFDRKFGSVTAGNSSFLTDGASAVLLMSEKKVNELGLEPIASIRSFAICGLDPWEELLLGPANAAPKALSDAGLELDEVPVLEFHEAFAAQMLANIKILKDSVGKIKMERMNKWGGSLSLGHPFGATGGRLITNCAHRMIHEKAKYGLVAACASGALGISMVLERP